MPKVKEIAPHKMTDAEINKAIALRMGWYIKQFVSKARGWKGEPGYKLITPYGYTAHTCFARDMWGLHGPKHATSIDDTLRAMRHRGIALHYLLIGQGPRKTVIYTASVIRHDDAHTADGPTPERALANAFLTLLRAQNIGAEFEC